MRKIIFIVFILSTILVASYFYINLGGAEKINFQYLESQDYTIIGKGFKGRYSDPKLETIFYETRDYLLNGEMSGNLVVINKGDDVDALQVDQIIGILIQGEENVIPEGYEKISMTNKKVVRAKLTSHNFVMKNPEDVRLSATQFSDSLKLRLSNVTIEQYLSDRELYVDYIIE